MLSKQFPLNGESLSAAIATTFRRRTTAIPENVPTALTDEFAADHTKQTQWTTFLNCRGLTDAPPDLASVIQYLRAFLLEPLYAAARKGPRTKYWSPGGPSA